MQIKREVVIILRIVAIVAAVTYVFLPFKEYNSLWLSVLWFCIGVHLSEMLPIWEKAPEKPRASKLQG